MARKSAKRASPSPQGGRPKQLRTRSKQEVVDEAMRLLHVSAVPAGVCGREAELAAIESFLDGCLAGAAGGSAYVSGRPGTGKSLCVGQAVARLQQRARGRVAVAAVNGMTVGDPGELYVTLMELLKLPDVDARPASTLLRRRRDALAAAIAPSTRRTARRGNPKAARAARKKVVLFVDEVDQLVRRPTAQRGVAEGVLLQLFQWTRVPGSPLVLVGAANSVNLDDALLRQLKREACEPHAIVFEPYSVEQLKAIVEERVRYLANEADEAVFHNDAINMCARKVTKASGDARAALQVCRRALERAAEQRPDVPLVVSLFDVSQSEGTRASGVAERIDAEALLSQLLLVGVMRAGSTGIALDELQRWHSRVCRPMLLRPPARSDLLDIIDRLAAAALLQVRGARARGFKRRVTASVVPEDFELAVGKNPTLGRLLSSSGSLAGGNMGGVASVGEVASV